MSKLYVYIMRSRNKDNREIDGFKERCRIIVDYEENEEKIRKEFELFASGGLVGEKTRLYKSVNARDEEKCRKTLAIRLIEGAPIAHIESLTASVCQRAECRAESKWLFDFDSEDKELLEKFLTEVKHFTPVSVSKTPHGYAIVADHGFDTRELLEKYSECDITLKRDDMLFLDMIEKH